MKFFLITVNTELRDNPVDQEFATMEALLAWVKAQEYEWTSLVLAVFSK